MNKCLSCRHCKINPMMNKYNIPIVSRQTGLSLKEFHKSYICDRTYEFIGSHILCNYKIDCNNYEKKGLNVYNE